MIHMHPPPPISSFNLLLGKLAKIKHHNHVISLYRRLDSVGIFPDFVTLNILLNCCCKTGRVCDGCAVLGKIFRGGWSLGTVTFTTLIMGLCMDRKIGEATRLLTNMSVFGCQPN
ncbi:hypothetical protein SLA2020_112730 [Shorea laevis]